MKKKGVPIQEFPYGNAKIVKIDLCLHGEPVKIGTLLRIKHDRTAWTFMGMYYNQELDVEWIDLRSPMGFKSVRPDKIVGEFIQKKSQRKKRAKSNE